MEERDVGEGCDCEGVGGWVTVCAKTEDIWEEGNCMYTLDDFSWSLFKNF